MTRRRFLTLFALTSAAGALALGLLGSASASPATVAAGGIAAVAAVVGICLLARVVVLTEMAQR